MLFCSVLCYLFFIIVVCEHDRLVSIPHKPAKHLEELPVRRREAAGQT